MAPYSVRLAEPIFALFRDISFEIVLKRVHSFPLRSVPPPPSSTSRGGIPFSRVPRVSWMFFAVMPPPFTSNLPTVGSFKNYVKTHAKSG